MSTVKAAPDTSARRLEGILSTLKTIVNDLTGIEIADMDIDANFLQAGIDSLTLIQASQAMQEQFGVKLSVVQLLEEHSTIAAVAGYLDQNLPPDFATTEQAPIQNPVVTSTPQGSPEVVLAAPPVQTQIEIAPPAETNGGPSNGDGPQSVGASSLERIMSQQLHLMSRQLEMLRGHRSAGPAPAIKTEPVAAPAEQPASAAA